MKFDPHNRIVKLCAQGMELEGEGKAEDALILFRKAWDEAVTDVEKFTAAHYVARHQNTITGKLKWDETALQFALRINDETVQEAYPSLYLNIAKCHEDLGQSDKAEENYRSALLFAGFLPNDGYGNMIRAGIDRGMERIKNKIQTKTTDMERKTKVHAGEGRQELFITREFDLPLELLFRAYAEPELVAQWMGTRVLKMENKKHGSYAIETSDAQGQVVFRANGTVHEFIPERKITRTFEMENTPFDVQLEFLEFESLTDDTSKLTIHTVFRSVERRDQLLKMPFAYGINMAHNRLQEIAMKKKENR